MKRLVIIDGKSVFYRGYYAMGALATSEGVPTGGVYGFAAIAMEIVQRLKPTKVVVAWDSPSSTAKRKALYDEYKAGRKKPEADFYAQIPYLKELVEALGWSFVECPEYEADDIIGTLARQADEAGDYETFIVSSDLDMLQVVDENTRMYRVLKGFSRLEELDVPAVEAKYGISKAQFLDLKALKGDMSDNIPGVPGVGEKTAVKLLNEYGSLTGIYEHLAEIPGAVRAKLAAGETSAKMSYQLAKIMTDAPVRLEELPDLQINRERVVAALEKLEFRSLVRKFLARPKVEMKGAQALSGWQEVAEKQAGAESVEQAAEGRVAEESQAEAERGTERGGGRTTAGQAEAKWNRALAHLKKAQAEGQNFGQLRFEVPRELADGTLVSWDVKTLMHKNARVAERVLGGGKFWDLGQAAFLLNPLQREIEPADEELTYLEQQGELLEMPKLKRILEEFDLPLIPILYKMEVQGMLIDRGYFAKLRQEFATEVATLEQVVWRLAGKQFNVNSPIQLSQVLFEDLGLPTKGIKKTARGYSTGVKELDKLQEAHPIIAAIKDYREAAKLLSTYIEPLPELADAQGRIHTTFTQNVTATGRLSSMNPNLQNIPVRTEVGKRIREGFVAPEGKRLVSADYSQFELRLAAALAGDGDLIRDFNAGVDIHTKTAAEAFGVPMEAVTKAQRRAAKVINFGILYGMSVKGLSEAAGMKLHEAKAFIERYFELRRPIKDYLERILKQAREQGYVETYFGRRRPTPDVRSANFVVRTAAERAAQNMPIQGTEADLMKRAMRMVDAKLPEGARLVCQVHDSLIVECEEGLTGEVGRILQAEMEAVMPELPVRR